VTGCYPRARGRAPHPGALRRQRGRAGPPNSTAPYVQIDGDGRSDDLPEAVESLVTTTVRNRGEHPDWDYTASRCSHLNFLIRVNAA